MAGTSRPSQLGLGALADVLARAGQRSRSVRYFQRVDEHLRGLSPGESLAFLRAELGKWQRRYELFQAEVFKGEPEPGGPTAWDYAETIAVLGTRIARIEREMAVA